MVGDCGCVREICTGVERRIDVYEAQFACEFRQEGSKDVFFVAPDEPVAPFRIAPAREKFKIPPSIFRALVDRLNGLKRQRNPHRPLLLALLVLSIPNEFCHEPRSTKFTFLLAGADYPVRFG